MSNLNGWGLTARLISKHFGVLGDKVSEAIANFDPETATEADRDRLAATLRETAQKLAGARASFEKEHADVVKLRDLIANDEKASTTLADRLATGKISEATVSMFCDELEANKAINYSLVRVDGGKDQDILKAYSVTTLPVFIIFKDGKQSWRKDGIATGKELEEQLK